MRLHLPLVWLALLTPSLWLVRSTSLLKHRARLTRYTGCLMQRVDTLNQKNEAPKHTFGALTLQVNRSIKSGQTVTLHTQTGRGGGCLTYIGPSGDQGGFVSWSVNCYRGTLCGPSIGKRARPSSRSYFR